MREGSEEQVRFGRGCDHNSTVHQQHRVAILGSIMTGCRRYMSVSRRSSG